MAASHTGAGSSLATGEVLVPAKEVTAHLPPGLKWGKKKKKKNIAREEGKKNKEVLKGEEAV